MSKEKEGNNDVLIVIILFFTIAGFVLGLLIPEGYNQISKLNQTQEENFELQLKSCMIGNTTYQYLLGGSYEREAECFFKDVGKEIRKKEQQEKQDLNKLFDFSFGSFEFDSSKVDLNSSLCKEGFTPRELSCSCNEQGCALYCYKCVEEN